MPDRLGDTIRLQHILDAISEIEAYTSGSSVNEFANNSMMFNASVRQLEIIGEAANRISSDLVIQHPQIPWARIIGLRNMVIHEYFSIDDFTIWNIIQYNLPSLKTMVTEILSALNKNQ